jgi:hypothetical protein
MSDTGTPTAAQRARTVQVLWAALTGSTLIYAMLAWILRSALSTKPRPLMTPAILGAAPLIALVVGGACLAALWIIGGAMGPSNAMPGDVEADPATADQRRWARIQSATLTMGALAETVAIIGLLLVFGGLTFERFLLFVGVSLLLHGVVWFRMQGWIAAALSQLGSSRQ